MKKDTLNRKAYPTDLTDEQWTVIAPLFSGMRQYKYSKRELLNAVLYLVDEHCHTNFRHIQRYTVFIAVQDLVVCGIKFYSIW